MSEYQYVAFRAIDGPVSESNLDYMRRQSTRAEITPWSFENEYHYGSFRGDAEEMLRRGYDVHLHYANYGIRTIMIRLPGGLPDAKSSKPYFEEERLSLSKGGKAKGEILCIAPFFESGELEDIWEPGEIFEDLLGLRAELLDGDLRPLYLAHLAVACDDDHDPEETEEAPVPAGLGKLSEAQEALAEFYGLDEHLIAAAAVESPPLPAAKDVAKGYLAWLERQPAPIKNAWLAQWMEDPAANARREMLAEFRKGSSTESWPTVTPGRTIAQLRAAAEEIRTASNRKADAAATRQRAQRLAKMKADPKKMISETEKLVQERSGEAYQQIASLLADLREALSNTSQADLAEKQARKLKERNPTLRLLVSELRKQAFLKK